MGMQRTQGTLLDKWCQKETPCTKAGLCYNLTPHPKVDVLWPHNSIAPGTGGNPHPMDSAWLLLEWGGRKWQPCAPVIPQEVCLGQ